MPRHATEDFVPESLGLTPGQQAQGKPIDLATTNPRTSPGVSADIDTIGKALDGTRWVKTGEGDTDWEQLFVSENGEFVANIELEDVGGTIPPVGVLGRVGGSLRLGDGETEGGKSVGGEHLLTAINRATGAIGTHSLTQDEWRKSAKFTSTKATAVTGTVRSTTGYVRIINCDGTRTTLGAGNPGSQISVNFDTPPAGYANLLPKFYAIFPCNSSGVVQVDEHLTRLDLAYNQLTSFDGTGLRALTDLGLDGNQLTSFDGTGLGALIFLSLALNQLTSFDGTGLGALTFLGLNGNQLPSFDGTGLGELSILDLAFNQLTSVLLPDFTGIQPSTWTTYSLDLSNQQMTTDAVYVMLDSIPSPAVDQPYPINLVGNPCDAGAGPALVEDGIHTQAEIEVLLTTKGYSLQLTGGTIAP